jgi:hypothetical protein
MATKSQPGGEDFTGVAAPDRGYSRQGVAVTFARGDYPKSDIAEVVDRNLAIRVAEHLSMIHQRDCLQVSPREFKYLDPATRALYTEAARLALHWCGAHWRLAARESAADVADISLAVGDQAADRHAERIVNAFVYTLIGDTLSEPQRRRLFGD